MRPEGAGRHRARARRARHGRQLKHLASAQVCDLKALTDVAHARGALVMVDNSIMTACYQRPLELGADVSMISATKFVGGHSDVTGGILSFKDPEIAQRCGLVCYFMELRKFPHGNTFLAIVSSER
jgi:kynureninase